MTARKVCGVFASSPRKPQASTTPWDSTTTPAPSSPSLRVMTWPAAWIAPISQPWSPIIAWVKMKRTRSRSTWPIAWPRPPTSCRNFQSSCSRPESSCRSRSGVVILSAAKDLCISVNRPTSSNAAATGRSHPCGRRGIRCEYFPGRILHRLRTREECGRHPKGSSDSPTLIPSTPASFFDWSPEPASIGEMPRPNRCGTARSGRDHAQRPARADSRGPSAVSTHARTSRCRRCAVVPALPVCTSGTTLAHSGLLAVLRGPHVRPAWFAAGSSPSSLPLDKVACADLRTVVPG